MILNLHIVTIKLEYENKIDFILSMSKSLEYQNIKINRILIILYFLLFAIVLVIIEQY